MNKSKSNAWSSLAFCLSSFLCGHESKLTMLRVGLPSLVIICASQIQYHGHIWCFAVRLWDADCVMIWHSLQPAMQTGTCIIIVYKFSLSRKFRIYTGHAEMFISVSADTLVPNGSRPTAEPRKWCWLYSSLHFRVLVITKCGFLGCQR